MNTHNPEKHVPVSQTLLEDGEYKPEEFFCAILPLPREKLSELKKFYGYRIDREDDQRIFYTSRRGKEFSINKNDPEPLVWFDDRSDALQIGVL